MFQFFNIEVFITTWIVIGELYFWKRITINIKQKLGSSSIEWTLAPVAVSCFHQLSLFDIHACDFPQGVSIYR